MKENNSLQTKKSLKGFFSGKMKHKHSNNNGKFHKYRLTILQKLKKSPNYFLYQRNYPSPSAPSSTSFYSSRAPWACDELTPNFLGTHLSPLTFLRERMLDACLFQESLLCHFFSPYWTVWPLSLMVEPNSSNNAPAHAPIIPTKAPLRSLSTNCAPIPLRIKSTQWEVVIEPRDMLNFGSMFLCCHHSFSSSQFRPCNFAHSFIA